VFEGIGDDGDVEFCLFDIENGQAGAVEADGAFFYDEVAEFFGEFEAEFPAAVELAAFEAGGGGVDVSLDDVAVEPAVHGHASFEVDQVAGLPAVEISFCEGLFDGGNAVSCAGVVGSAGGGGTVGSGGAVGVGSGGDADFFYGETDAVMGNALVDLQFGGEGGLDPEGLVGAFDFDGLYFSERFDNSGKHGGEFRKKWADFSVFREIALLLLSDIFSKADHRFADRRSIISGFLSQPSESEGCERGRARDEALTKFNIFPQGSFGKNQ